MSLKKLEMICSENAKNLGKFMFEEKIPYNYINDDFKLKRVKDLYFKKTKKRVSIGYNIGSSYFECKQEVIDSYNAAKANSEAMNNVSIPTPMPNPMPNPMNTPMPNPMNTTMSSNYGGKTRKRRTRKSRKSRKQTRRRNYKK